MQELAADFKEDIWIADSGGDDIFKDDSSHAGAYACQLKRRYTHAWGYIEARILLKGKRRAAQCAASCQHTPV